MTDMPQSAERGRNSDDRRRTNAGQPGRSIVDATAVSLIPVDGQSDGAAILRQEVLSRSSRRLGFCVRRSVGRRIHVPRVIRKAERPATDRVTPERAELVLKSDAASSEFEADQTLSNQETMNRRQRRLLETWQVQDTVEPPGMFCTGSSCRSVANRVATQHRKAAGFKGRQSWLRKNHVLCIDMILRTLQQTTG